MGTENSEIKRAEMLAAAMALIVERGYADTTLDLICTRAACSKSSIYTAFGSKAGLLATLVEEIPLSLAAALHALHLPQLGVEDALRRYARMSLRLLLSDNHIAILRATIAETWQHPRLGPNYFALGMGAAHSALTQYLEAQTRGGTLVIADANAAAHAFHGRLLWDHLLACLLGARPRPADTAIDAIADAAVLEFLNRYAASAGASPPQGRR